MKYLSPLVILAALLTTMPTWAIVEKVTSLEQIVRDSQVIAVARVSRIDRESQRLLLTIEETMKGEPAVQRIAVDLNADSVAQPGSNPDELLDRVEPEAKVVVFLTEVGTEHLIFAYARGSWFHLSGPLQNGVVRARYQNTEPVLRKTYRNDVDALLSLLDDHIQRGKPLPRPDVNAKPGLGPKIGANELAIEEPVFTNPGTTDGQFEFPSGSGPPRPISPTLLWSLLGLAACGLLFMLTRRTPIEARHD